MQEISVSRMRIGGWFHIVKEGDGIYRDGRGRYFGVCVVLVEKGRWFSASIDPQLEGGYYPRDRAQSEGRR